jgi:hypothetical protein
MKPKHFGQKLTEKTRKSYDPMRDIIFFHFIMFIYI